MTTTHLPFLPSFIYLISVYRSVASLSKYADPLLDILDPNKLIKTRLFRENCVFFEGHYVKDLSLLDREINQTIIVDNSPMSYIFHPENAIDCTSFFDDFQDIELWQIADFLLSIKSCPDVRKVCPYWREWVNRNPSSVPMIHLLLDTNDNSNDINNSNSSKYSDNSNSAGVVVGGGFSSYDNNHHESLYNISSSSSSSSSSNSKSSSGNHTHSYL